MKISALHLENFRGFATFDLDLHPTVTLIVGRNASGKSAILDALAIGLGAWMTGTTQARVEDRPINRTDARLVRQEGDGLATVNPSFPVIIRLSGHADQTPLSWTRELRHTTGRTTSGQSKAIRALAEKTERDATDSSHTDLPLFAYHGTGRLWVQKNDTQAAQPNSRMQGYAACLESASNTKRFQRWMAWRENDRLQRISAAAERGEDITTVTTPHLDAVVDAARACLAGARRLYYSANHEELRIEFTDGRILPFDQLSDGQRSLIVLAADLAWRAAQLNPHHGADAPRLATGVVLIDEIELHLHPEWQGTVIDSLTRSFPSIQFVITTHSPQVVATAQPEWLRTLHVGGVDGIDHVHGRDSNAILRDVMGVDERPVWMKARLAQLESHLENGCLADARALLEALRLDLGSSDTALMALEWELHDQERGDAND